VSLTITINDPDRPHERRSSEVAFIAGAVALALSEFQRGGGLVLEGRVEGTSATGASHTSLGSWSYTPGAER
jgi:hypothetical protein